MSSPHEWLTVQMPQYFSAWLWRTFRRPRRFLFLVILTPLVLILGFTHWVNVRRARLESLQHLIRQERVRPGLQERHLRPQRRPLQPQVGKSIGKVVSAVFKARFPASSEKVRVQS